MAEEEIPQEYDLSLTKKRETLNLLGPRISQTVQESKETYVPISPSKKKRSRTCIDYRLFGFDLREMRSTMKRDDEESKKTHCSLDLCLGLAESPNPYTKGTCAPRNGELTEDANEEREEEITGISTQLIVSLDDADHRQEENPNSPWTIEKTLTTSDIGNLSRLMLKKSEVESHIITHLPEHLRTTIHKYNEVKVKVFDHNTNTEHDLVLKRWFKSSRSYVLNGGWVKHFVQRKKLKQGDKIGLFWNTLHSRLHFCVLSEAPAVQNEP